MCDCENMTTSVRDEKIALVFETVFEEHAGDEGEVYPHCTSIKVGQNNCAACVLQVKWEQLQEVLAILGRRVGKERVMKLKYIFRDKTPRSSIQFHKEKI